MQGLEYPPPTPERDVWTEKAAVIRQLYLSERKTLKQVKETLEREHEFPTFPLSTYETTLRDKLRLRKKLKRTDWPIVYHHFRSRDGKETGVYLNGVRIPWNKAWKEIRRSGARSTSNINHPDPLPEGVVVRTPSPVIRSMSPAFPEFQGSLHSAFSPPAQTSPVAQYGTIGIDLRSYSDVSVPTHDNLQDFSLVQYTSLTTGEGGTMAGTHNFDTSFYRSFLETTPWNQFNKKMRLIVGNIVQLSSVPDPASGRLFDHDLMADFIHFLPSSLAHRATLPEATHLSRPSGSSAVPALNFSSYHLLTKFFHLLSNNMNILKSPDIGRHILEFFDILIGRLPNRLLLKLFESDLPTMRAAWEASVPLAHRVGHKGAFSLLMEVGLQHSDWILADGHTYLSLAVSIGCIGIVRGLLGIGVRADDVFQAYSLKRMVPAPAILEAAIAEDLDCVKELIQGCDVNRNISHRFSKHKSNFDFFILAMMQRYYVFPYRPSADVVARTWVRVTTGLEEGIHSLVLDILLASGANVDLPWTYSTMSDSDSVGDIIIHRAISRLHRANDIPMQWNLSLLEQSFYWDTELYDRLRLYSVKEEIETTRPGICLSAKRGEEFLQAYLDSRPSQHPAERTKLLELILAEQFLLENIRAFDLEVIRGLINFGVDINFPHLELGFYTSSRNELLLYNIVVKSRLDGFTRDFSALIALLIGRGVIIDADVIEASVAETGLGVLPELAEHGADIKAQGGLALCTAAHLNNFEAVSWLLQVGVDINADVHRKHWAMPRAIIEVAIGHGLQQFDPNDLYVREEEYSSSSANIEMLGYLIHCGAKLRLNSQNPSHFHFLKNVLVTKAYDSLLLDKMKLFLNFVAIPEDLATTDETLLESCSLGIQIRLRRRRIFHKFDRALAAYELLLRRGCPVLRESGLAYYIFSGGRHEVIYKVLDAGADVNACSRESSYVDDRTYPLQSAAMRGDLELVMQLLQRGAVINQPALGCRGRTALQGACEWTTLSTEERANKMDLIKLLINQGADVNAPAARDEGMTALQIAALYGDIELALILLEHGANPNAPPASYGGYCALDAAALEGRLDMVDLLLSTAAHSYRRGQSGYEGAIELAIKNGHFAVADLIREHIRLFGNCIIVDLNDDECSLSRSQRV
ncbi:hypothetical protein F4782DRAFT_531329 [Xylaria castorea]|nr:hypothetical protein F4782DRAFT_531329 [Xylaria castorea]